MIDVMQIAKLAKMAGSGSMAIEDLIDAGCTMIGARCEIHQEPPVEDQPTRFAARVFLADGTEIRAAIEILSPVSPAAQKLLN